MVNSEAAGSGTVFVVDDDPSVRSSLVRLLGSAGYPARAFESGDVFLKTSPGPDPACLVLDLTMPGHDGLEVQQAIHDRGWVLPVVFVTGHGDIPASVRAMKAGATDFLTKPIEASDLLQAVARALTRAQVESHEREELEQLRARYETLTPREREVMVLVVRGLLNKQTAGHLGTAEKTVKVHRARVMQKMRADSLADLVRAAGRLGLG